MIRWYGIGLVLLLAGLIGCKSNPRLVPTPNLYVSTKQNPFDQTDEAVRTTTVEILFGTDRVRADKEDGTVSYGPERSHALVVGTCTVEISGVASWDALVAASLSGTDSARLPLRVAQVNERVQFPPSVAPMVMEGDTFVEPPSKLEGEREAARQVHELLAARLDKASRKELFVFIHGVGNKFESPMYRITDLWHYMGRPGVPVVYTWPAGGSGLLRGYTYDRESSEFTIYHLRQFLLTLAACPQVERIHIVSHSRGTDVTMTALRELQIQCVAAGRDTRQVLKLGNVVLAAPDIDWQVAQQRSRPDLVHLVPQRLTIYASQHDDAIGMAEWLFASVRRMGQLTRADISQAQSVFLKSSLPGRFEVIDTDVKSQDRVAHNYFVTNPAVLSDLILLLRDNRSAGAANGRPLKVGEGGFWQLTDDYLLKERICR